MTLNISELLIEVTRKCNMQCEHCLRGSAQRKTIDNQYIYKILQLIDNVSTISITGGEPTLAMESLEQIRHCIIYGNCDVQSFYMATNGKVIHIDELAGWTYNMLRCCSDNELSRIGFSFDPFHTNCFNRKQEEKQKRNYYNLKDKLEYDYGIVDAKCGGDFVIKHSDKSWDYTNLIAQGRAKDFGTKNREAEPFEIDEYDDTVCINETELYLSCSGWLVAGCNWSYNSMDYNTDIQIAHIDGLRCTDDLIGAIKEYNKRVETAEKKLQCV